MIGMLTCRRHRSKAAITPVIEFGSNGDKDVFHEAEDFLGPFRLYGNETGLHFRVFVRHGRIIAPSGSLYLQANGVLQRKTNFQGYGQLGADRAYDDGGHIRVNIIHSLS
jgi:hypothetical protein